MYSFEIEEVLRRHDAVAEVAVIGIPDEKWGEAVKALVILKPDLGKVAKNDLRDEYWKGYDRKDSLRIPKRRWCSAESVIGG